ncbi:hypothetical protein ACODZ9_005220, partial [Escherichia coli]
STAYTGIPDKASIRAYAILLIMKVRLFFFIIWSSMQYGKHATGMAYKPPPCVQEIILFSANNDNIKNTVSICQYINIAITHNSL